MKYGAYVTVCINFLVFSFSTSFRHSARIIANGKEAAMLYRLRVTVLRITIQEEGDVKNRLKCARPTHGLPQMPRELRKFLNAN